MPSRSALFLAIVGTCLGIGCSTSPEEASEKVPRPDRVRLIDLLDHATVEGPLTAVDEAPEPLSTLAALYPVADLTFETAPPWLVKRVPLLAVEQKRIEERQAVFLPPPSQLTLPIRIPWPSRLRFYLGVKSTVEEEPAQGVHFEVFFQPDGQEAESLVSRVLTPAERPEDQSWVRVEADLSAHSGITGKLVFRTRTPADGGTAEGVAFALVANPELVPSAANRADDERLNVLLIGIDTLRADHLGTYGYPRPTSPHIDSLAAEGLRFAQVIAPAPWTLPSFTSLLTSLYPSRHGAGRGGRGGYTHAHPDTLLLSEILYSEGYRTAGMTGSYIVSSRYGLEQGYETYRHPYKAAGFESSPVDTPEVVKWLEESRDSPFFLFWHIMDPHLPYWVEQPEIVERFVEPEYEGPFEHYVDYQILVQRPGRRRYAHEGHPDIPEMSDADRRRIIDFYDAEIAETDAHIGTVLNALENLGLADNTIVIVTADHGEGLGEHGHYHHGYTLYEDQIRIPLILRWPGGPKGEVFNEPVSTVDLLPLLLDTLGLAVPEDVQGVNRLTHQGQPPPIFSEYATLDSSALKAVTVGSSKYLHDPIFGQEELFELTDDPGETRNLLLTDSTLGQRERLFLDRFREHNLRGGRYHLLVQAPAGATVTGRLTAGEVFDANAVLVPGGSDAVSFDMDRMTLSFEAPLPEGRGEVIFWYRGEELAVDLAIDGVALPDAALLYGDPAPSEALPGAVASTERIPTVASTDIALPAGPGAVLWLEQTGLTPLRKPHSEEEIERLRALGYVD